MIEKNKIEKMIDNKIDELLKEKIIGEGEVIEAKTILTWINLGRREAEKVSKKAVKNLIKNGFVSKDGKTLIMGDGIWFLLAVLGAKGYVERLGVM